MGTPIHRDKQAKILQAEGEAQAIQLVNDAADKYFVGNAQLLRKLEMVEAALSANTKIVQAFRAVKHGPLVPISGESEVVHKPED